MKLAHLEVACPLGSWWGWSRSHLLSFLLSLRLLEAYCSPQACVFLEWVVLLLHGSPCSSIAERPWCLEEEGRERKRDPTAVPSYLRAWWPSSLWAQSTLYVQASQAWEWDLQWGRGEAGAPGELVELQYIFLGSPELLEGGTYLWEQPGGWRGSWAPSMHLSLSQSQVWPYTSASLSWLFVADSTNLTVWLPLDKVRNILIMYSCSWWGIPHWRCLKAKDTLSTENSWPCLLWSARRNNVVSVGMAKVPGT